MADACRQGCPATRLSWAYQRQCREESCAISQIHMRRSGCAQNTSVLTLGLTLRFLQDSLNTRKHRLLFPSGTTTSRSPWSTSKDAAKSGPSRCSPCDKGRGSEMLFLRPRTTGESRRRKGWKARRVREMEKCGRRAMLQVLAGCRLAQS